jgi:hypothetical protein
MNMSMVVEVIGGTEPGKMTILIDSVGEVDNKDKEMQLTMNMNMDIPGQGTQTMGTELYADGNWLYMKISIPGSDAQWIKTRLTEEIWNSQNQAVQQLALLETAQEVTLVGKESVRGLECNVVQVKPSTDGLSQLLAQQMGAMQDSPNLAELLQGLSGTSIKEWIAVDSNLLMKSALAMSMEVNASDLGAEEGSFDKMTMDITMDFEAYDYNQAVTVEVPQEALSAEEVSG